MSKMEIKKVQFRITGVTPLLMHNPVGGLKQAGGSSEIKSAAKNIPTPEEEAKRSVYADPKTGQLRGPAAGFRSAIVSAAKGMRLGKVSAASVLQGTVFAMDEWVYLEHPETHAPITTWTIDTRRVVVKAAGKGAGVLRSRARVDEWSCVLTLDLNLELVAAEVVLDFLQRAGQTIGFLDFRPQSRGSFGRFEAELVGEAPAKKKAK